MERFISREGAVFVRAENVIPGMKLDFEGDRYADPDRYANPDGDHPPSEFEYEFARVIEIERETPECIVIHTTLGRYGFPPEHEIETTAYQLPVVIADSTKEGDESIVMYCESLKEAEAEIAAAAAMGTSTGLLDREKIAQGLYHIDSDDEA